VRPRLSVVVTVVDAGDALERCLTALASQSAPPPFEVIIPWDASLPDAAAFERRFPEFRFLKMGMVSTARDPRSHAGQHELFDRRRAAGLRVVQGDYVAILEDRGVPRSDWAATMIHLHQVHQAAAIGGAIENGYPRLLNWAVYFCDFGRYQLPFEAGPRPYVSDVNICYRREALEQTRDLWAERYHETTVHWALIRAGQALWLCPESVVDQHRGELRLPALVKERRDWGRLFAYTRARECRWPRRILLALGTAVLPLVLIARHTLARVRKRRTLVEFIEAAPVIVLLLVAWSYGEFQGYLTSEP